MAKQLEQQKVYEPIKGDRDQYIYIYFFLEFFRMTRDKLTFLK